MNSTIFHKACGHGFVWSLLLSVFALLWAGQALGADIGLVDGLWVMKKAEERYKGTDRRENLTLTVYRENRPDRKKVMKVLWFEKDYGKEDKVVVHFTEPDFVAGTNLLMHVLPYRDDNRWLYFSQEKVYRRIRSRDKHNTFMGTNFTYDDLAEHEPDEENHKLLRIEDFDGRTCYVVESTPKDLATAGYSRTVTWVEKEHFVKVKIDYWDLGGRKLKTYTAGEIVAVEKAWFPTLLRMRSEKKGQNTVVKREFVKINIGLEDKLFEPHNLADFPYGEL